MIHVDSAVGPPPEQWCLDTNEEDDWVYQLLEDSSVIFCTRSLESSHLMVKNPLSRLQLLLLVMTMLWQVKRKTQGLRVLTDVARNRARDRAVAVGVLARLPRRLRAARSPRARTEASVAADVRRPARSCALQNACTDRKLHVML